VFSVDRKVFPLTGKCFPLTGKCFPLTNFPNGKQTQESLESGFPESEFRETNMALINLKFDSPIGNGPAEAQNQHF
jgi:hypothetical protein